MTASLTGRLAISFSGMTNSAQLGLAIKSITGPNGSLSVRVKLRSSTTSSFIPSAAILPPAGSFIVQRPIEAAASAARTGEPSWNSGQGEA